MRSKRGGHKLLVAATRLSEELCPKCKVKGVVKQSGDESFIECPQCGRKIHSIILRD